MKCICVLIGTLALVPGAAVAQASDSSRYVTTFTGMKVGASVDYRWYDGDYSLPLVSGKLDRKTGTVGYRAHAGYDAEIGSAIVIGVEGGIGRGGKALRASTTIGDYAFRPRWAWDVSARVGVLPAPTVLLYGRAGYSWLRVRETTDFRATNLKDLKTSSTEKGFLWGAGVETNLGGGLFARAEYNRVNYGNGLTSPKVQLALSLGL